MCVNNIICQEIKAPVTIWQWTGSEIFIGLLQLLLNFGNIQSFFGTGLFHCFLATTTEVQSIFFKDLCFAQIFSSKLTQCFIVISADMFAYSHLPPFRTLLQVFPFENISPFAY